MVIITCSFSSCFEILEEITLKPDGSGKMVLTINMSQSRTKLASIQLMDSVNGYKVPQEADIKKELVEAEKFLKQTPGITSVSSTANFKNYIGTISFNFKDVSNINALTTRMLAKQKIKVPNSSTYSYNASTKVFDRRYVPAEKAKNEFYKMKAEDRAIFKTATYTSIYRFQNNVSSTTNAFAKVSGSKKAVMMKANVMDLINGNLNISNKIQLQ